MNTDAHHSPQAGTGRSSLRLLLLGASAGLLLGGLAAAGKLGGEPLADSIVARVNGVALPAQQYQRALNLFGSEKRGPVTDRDRALVLERMIEEQLLLQHGLDSGVMRWHNKVREEALKSILAGLVIELESGEPGVRDNSVGLKSEDGTEAGPAPDQPVYDLVLEDYLGRLRATATIRRVGG